MKKWHFITFIIINIANGFKRHHLAEFGIFFFAIRIGCAVLSCQSFAFLGAVQKTQWTVVDVAHNSPLVLVGLGTLLLFTFAILRAKFIWFLKSNGSQMEF